MKELVDYLSGRIGIANKAMLEKDILLHRILLRLMNNKQFKEGFAFKGGTCLTKCYFGYYRFSEDIDFTYINQDEFKNLSQKEVRKLLSKKINETIELLIIISKELNLDFQKTKSDDRYIEMGGSNKFVTFKLWYISDVLKLEQFTKIQINFYEMIIEKIQQRKAVSLYSKIPQRELKLFFPEYIEIIEEVPLQCYSLVEIFYEKIRAILTRRGMKSRDYIDAFIIQNANPINIKSIKGKIIKKIEFMLRYDKYIQNISMFDKKDILYGDEEKLMLVPLPEGYDEFVKELSEYLKEIITAVKSKIIQP